MNDVIPKSIKEQIKLLFEEVGDTFEKLPEAKFEKAKNHIEKSVKQLLKSSISSLIKIESVQWNGDDFEVKVSLLDKIPRVRLFLVE